MSHADYYHGDSRATMRHWANLGGIPTPWGSQLAHLILTSPPFLALRSYLPDNDPAKALEMGSEPTPAAFLDALLDWTAAAADLLSPEGSLCVELGDTYSGSGGGGGDYLEGGLRDGQPVASARRNAVHARTNHLSGEGWPLAKCRTLIPELYRVALAYGTNPLTGTPSPAGQWRVRNVVTWARPNPPVGALGDKYRPATSDLVIACRSEDRWFDLDAVRHHNPRVDEQTTANDKGGIRGPQQSPQNQAGSPPLDWWEIPTQPYPGSHYATWPARLCETPIRSMCPTEVSVSTGQGRRRITGEATYVNPQTGKPATTLHLRDSERVAEGVNQWVYEGGDALVVRSTNTLGWSDTDPNGQYRPGIVLDPFAGSGTTLAVATGHGRYAIGIDLDSRNADLARERVGPLLLTVHDA